MHILPQRPNVVHTLCCLAACALGFMGDDEKDDPLLLALWAKKQEEGDDEEGDDDEEDEEFDSEATSGEDPMYSKRKAGDAPMPKKKRKLDVSEVLDAAEKMLKKPQEEKWCKPKFLAYYPQPPDKIVDFCAGVIKRELCMRPQPFYFKIGITEKVEHRWRNDKYGYEKDGGQEMWILHVAPESYRKVPGSSGFVEDELIKQFGSHPSCLNCVPGGGGASCGTPHYCYVVWY